MTTAESATPKILTLRDLQGTDATLYVRNESPLPITCNVGVGNDSNKIRFFLGPKGADDSVAVLPKEVALQPGFQKVWMRKQVTISDDPEMLTEIMLQNERQTLAEVARKSAVSALVDVSSSSRSMVERRCLITGERVFQTEVEVRDMVPPLAERFSDQAHLFTPTKTVHNGEEQTVWSKFDPSTGQSSPVTTTKE